MKENNIVNSEDIKQSADKMAKELVRISESMEFDEEALLDMVQEIDDELGRCDCRDQFEIIEVKEKYGMLRVYWIGKDQFPDGCNIGDIIFKYEKMSGHICPNCGRYKNPIKWLCGRCANDN